MKRILSAVAIFATLQSTAQQINPVPDYVFRNQMSVGRNAVTDTAAYFSIGPRYGANKGFMPPIVGDTTTFSSGKRNGLLIFSVQKNKFLYWDSVRVQWSDMAGSSGAYIVAGDTASMLTPYVRQAGYGLTKSGQSFLVDTLNIATRAWRQKGVDSVAGLSRIGGSGTAFYIPRFATSSTLQNSIIYDDGAKVGVGTSSPIGTFQVYKSGAPAYITLTGGSGANQGAAFVIYKSNNSLSLINIGDKAALVGGAPDTAVTFRAGANVPLIFEPNASEALRLNNNQTITATSLAGSGSRIVVADANGTLSASSALSGYVDGSGTTNYVPKFTAGSTIGNSQIFADANGVGIGITDPASYLTGGRQLVVANTSGAAGTTIRTSNTGDGSIFFSDGTTGDETYRGYVQYIHASDALRLGTSATERLRITSDGNVGIGATGSLLPLTVYNPTLNTPVLEVRGGGGSSQTRINLSYGNTTSTTLNGDIFASTTDFALRAQAGRNMWFGTDAVSGSTNRMQIFANGRIGINTTTDAGYQLDINGTLRSVNGANFATTSGNVGIGGTSPQAKLDVYGAFRVSSATFNIPPSGAGIEYSFRPGDSTGYVLTFSRDYNTYRNQRYFALTHRFSTSNSELDALFINASQETLINTTTDAGDYKLQVSGNIYNTGSITTGAPSGGSIKPWKIGEAATVSPTSPNRTIRVEIDGVVYYLHAKTTND